MKAAALDPAGRPLDTAWFSVPTIRCAGCIAKLENGLAATPGVAEARVNFSLKRVRITHTPDVLPEQLAERLDSIGFPATAVAQSALTNPVDPEIKRLQRALAVAAFASMNIMLLSVSVWSGATGLTRDLFHWISAAIALPAVAYAGQPFFTSAWGALRRGHTNMDVPISIGVLMACAISIYETANSGPHAYFDGAVMLLFFLLGGRLLDSVMRGRAADGAGALLRERPAEASVMRGDVVERRPVAELAPNMRVLVAAGERIPGDGVVEQGRSTIDRSLVTGESAPEPAGPGSAVLTGTINLDAPLTVKLVKVGEDTVIAEIARTIEAAAQSKSRYVRVADRAARLYAPAVHTLAALSLVTWLLLGAGLHQSVLIAVAVLIITCPCALGLAVPVAQVVAVGALMREGVIVRDGAALEKLAEADVALFDKTGTVTLGRPVLEAMPALTPDERAAALTLARASRHPLSRALAAALDGSAAADAADLVEHPGLGVEARFSGVLGRLGRADWAGVAVPADRATLTSGFALGESRHLFTFTDAPRPDAGATIARLRTLGLSPRMISGDRVAAVEAVAGPMDLPAEAALSPVDKLARIEALKAAGKRVLMVGDGLNDGPALAAAHVSIAPASASDVGQAAADLIITGDSLAPVARAVVAARRTMAVVRQNFVMAIGYNVLAVPLAFMGKVTPLVAALAMSGSSILVVANALRLRGAAR